MQVIDLNKAELNMVADHLGHSLKIHTTVYRMQQNANAVQCLSNQLAQIPHFVRVCYGHNTINARCEIYQNSSGISPGDSCLRIAIARTAQHFISGAQI